MTKIIDGYASEATIAIFFDEDDVGKEYIPFESISDCWEIAAAIIDEGYGGAYGMTQEDLVRDFDASKFGDAFKGAVPESISSALLEADEVTVDDMSAFDDIVISLGWV